MFLFDALYFMGIFALILFLSIVLGLFFFQNNLLYMPVIFGSGIQKSSSLNPVGYRNPQERGMFFEDVVITAEDGINLHGWFIKHKQNINDAKNPTIVFFHENAGNIGTRLEYLENYTLYTQFNFLIIAYRGYSDSEGSPTERGIEMDSKAMLKYIFSREDIDTSKIFLHGRSLGGAVVNYVMTHTNYPVAGIILENTFTSIADLIDIMFPKLAFMKKLIQRNYWPSVDRINQINKPILFIMAMKDEIVPPVQMLRLFKKAEKSTFKQKYVIEEGMHNTSWSLNPNEYFASINQFVDQVNKLNQNEQF